MNRFELQDQITKFCRYYNEVRPHPARGTTPGAAFGAKDKATPSGTATSLGAEVRLRRDKVGKNGKVTLRYRSELLHLGIGRSHQGKPILMLIDGQDVRVVDTTTYEPIGRFMIDPSRNYQVMEKPT